jgi:hypothetical protein
LETQRREESVEGEGEDENDMENFEGGNTPRLTPSYPPRGFPVYSYAMKPKPMGKALTFGELIANFYNACGKRRAKEILRLLIKAQLVVFRKHYRYALSTGNRKV